MKYKVGDKVKVKSLEWYNDQKGKDGCIYCSELVFFKSNMSKFCGSILTIKDKDAFSYEVEENNHYWTDDMFEGLAEEKGIYKDVPNKICRIFISNKDYQDKVELCLGDDYEIIVEDGKTFVQRKKPKYPTNYEECCGVLGITYDFPDIKMVSIDEYYLYSEFIRLIRCRDAYWKIAGEQMGLGKSWVPDWADNYQKKWLITFYQGEINFTSGPNVQFVLAFPTEEMRDEFFENFKDLIEKCKQLL